MKRQTKVILVIGTILVGAFLLLNFFLYQSNKKSKADQPESVQVLFNPNTLTTPNTVRVKMKPQNVTAMNVVSYKLKIPFDKTKIKVTSITYQMGRVSQGLGDDGSTANLQEINNRGYVLLRGEVQTAGGQTVTAENGAVLAELGFDKVTTPQQTTVGVDAAESAVNKMLSNGTIEGVLTADNEMLTVNGPAATNTPTPNPNATNTPTPTPNPNATNTPTPNPNATNTPTPIEGNTRLLLRLKFQGIQSQPEESRNSMNVKVTVVKRNGEKEEVVVPFQASENGVWRGTAAMDLAAGNTYKVFVKGPKHIQKRVCVNEPTESAPGTYHCELGEVHIVPGEQTLDFKDIYMLAGDLPEQDGVVDSYDIALVRNNLGKSDAESVATSDLNLDGVVDSQDYAMIIAALSVRTDEGEE